MRVKKVPYERAPYENVDHIRSPDPRSKLSICVIRTHDGREFVGVSERPSFDGQNEARERAVRRSRECLAGS